MRLLTHNSTRNNAKEANHEGYPLQIEVQKVQVHNHDNVVSDKEIAFVQRLLTSGTIDWCALVQVRS